MGGCVSRPIPFMILLKSALESRINKLVQTDMVSPRDTRRFRRLGEQFLNKLGGDIGCKLIVSGLIGRHEGLEIALTKEAIHILLNNKQVACYAWESAAREYGKITADIRMILDKTFNQ